MAGNVQGTPTSVTVAANGGAATEAIRYGDGTFARTNVTLVDGTNTFTAVATDALSRYDTNTVMAYLPATVTLAYDLNGNLRTNGTRLFDYDDENQLTSVTEPGAWKSWFAYDGKMRRRVRTEAVWNSAAWATNLFVRYVYDGNLVVQERYYNPQVSSSAVQQIVTYTRGSDLSGSLEGAGGIGGLLARSQAEISNPECASHAYYHADGNGNVTCLIGTNQIVVARYLYDPFGNILSATGPLAEANRYRFSSKELHANSGLSYFLYRYFESLSQRWTTRDPLADGASLAYAVNYFDAEADLGLSAFILEAVEGPNLYGFAANHPTGFWDAFGTGKGGKQNISCEGFTKRSCPEDVAKALEEAKALKQAKRIKALRALLKVIKRGGTRVFFWLEYYLELLNQGCGLGGGHETACNVNTHMTSDGISEKDWETVKDYAAQIANAVCIDDDASATAITEKLLLYLERLETKYGKLPSIMATKADYMDDLTGRVQLLQEAFEIARRANDRENMTLIASSLAQVFVEEAADVASAEQWLSALADALGSRWDDLEHNELRRLTARIERLKQERRPDLLT